MKCGCICDCQRQRAAVYAADYLSGLSLEEVANKHDTYVSAVTRFLDIAGVPRRRRGGAKGSLFPGRVAEFKRRYLAGETLQQIADGYGITRERVRQVLRKEGVESLGLRAEHCRKAGPLTDIEIEVSRLYAEGVSPREITALHPGVNVNKALHRTGVPVRPRGAWLARPDDAHITSEVVRLYREGRKAREIAAAVGLAHDTKVYYYLRKAGVRPAYRAGPHAKLRQKERS